jgi:hypothetical protein
MFVNSYKRVKSRSPCKASRYVGPISLHVICFVSLLKFRTLIVIYYLSAGKMAANNVKVQRN